MGPEAKIERGLAKYATSLGWHCRKWTSPSTKGVPDHIFINPEGVVFFIEFKGPKGKLSKLQEREIRLIKNNKANALVISDLKEGKKFVDENLQTI